MSHPVPQTCPRELAGGTTRDLRGPYLVSRDKYPEYIARLTESELRVLYNNNNNYYYFHFIILAAAATVKKHSSTRDLLLIY